MSEENEGKTQIYYIPHNYEEAGGMLGGHLNQRNGIELIVLCGPLAYLELKFLNFSWQTNIIIALLTLVPLATITIFGIGGESLSQRLFAVIRFRRNRKRLTYRSFVTESTISSGGLWSFGDLLDNIAALGFKGALMQSKSKKKATVEPQAQEESDEEYADEYDEEFDTPEQPTNRTRNNAEPHRAAPKQAKKAPARRRKTSGTFVNSALKEKLLQKLELGEDDDEDERY